MFAKRMRSALQSFTATGPAGVSMLPVVSLPSGPTRIGSTPGTASFQGLIGGKGSQPPQS